MGRCQGRNADSLFARACWGLTPPQCRVHLLNGKRLQQVGISVHQNGLEMALEHMPHLTTAVVE